MRISANLKILPAALIFMLLSGCGGGKSSSSGPGAGNGSNTQAVVVNSGPAGNYANGLFTSVTICASGTSNCQTINGVLVDTMSFGVRILSSALSSSVSSALGQEKDANGNSVAECAVFSDGITWGSVKTADVKIAGERASATPIQIIGDPSFSSIPSGCTNSGKPEDDLQSLGTNGIFGIGPFVQDGGSYYGCPGSSCVLTTITLAQQVQNPVASFATDNNGVVVQLPAASSSAATLNGTLIFGIGTQSNNSLGSAQVLTLDPNTGNFSANFKGKSYSTAFIDSGSNAYFFLDSTTTVLPTCPSPETGFYCPSSPASLFATNIGVNGASNNISFTIDNANTLFSNSADAVFPTLGGPNSGAFDWGLPFFYGRNVYVAIEGKSTPGGIGPYWAY